MRDFPSNLFALGTPVILNMERRSLWAQQLRLIRKNVRDVKNASRLALSMCFAGMKRTKTLSPYTRRTVSGVNIAKLPVMRIASMLYPMFRAAL